MKPLLITSLTVLALIVGASVYMLDYSLSYPTEERLSAEHWKERMKDECPWIEQWMDSIYEHGCVRDTFIEMSPGRLSHAIYLYAPKDTLASAVIVHGYKVRAEGMLHIAYLYNHTLGYNVLLPDLYGHGQSQGEHIQMGWEDRWDVIKWSEVADKIFSDSTTHTNMVLHGISMGAATVMAVSGETTPDYIKCFVEDCGFSGVWDEFEAQLKDQFYLPAFPLMYTTSWLCKMRYGWSFAEANQLSQVSKSTKPMLFIHGDQDLFVPYTMLRPLYDAKTTGHKDIYVAQGSEHAMAYSDHHTAYTERVKNFLLTH